ncbi:MAG: hypothetical protein Q8M29_02430 [Bacteroidota bacterium]|nr:hypothetical protein [Bacteroidota bacterium]
MLKYIILLINSISILFYNIFFGDGVTITPKLPANAKPGTEFTAEMVIKKGSIGGFSKLQIDLPQGFTAKELESKGGTFSFVNGAVKYIWTALPADEEFTVKFIIVADASSEGTKTVQGKFSYILNNTKQQVDFGPVDIIMDGAGTSAVITNTSVPTNTVAATTTTNTTTPSGDGKVPESFSPPKDPNAAVSSNRRITNISATEYDVVIEIKKENIKGFAKYTDKIPAGFKATGIKTNGASFSFSDQVAKFVWVSLPSAEELQISYKLIMDTKPDANPVISGEFSYLENDQTQKIVAPETTVNLPQEETPVVTNTVTPTNTVVPETNTVTPTTNTVAATNTVVPETNTVTATTNTVDPVATNTIVPETNVTKITNASLNFQVQIGAFRNNISVDRIASVYNINDNIRTDMHEGYTKFLIGSYSEYKGARDKRESVKGKVSGAFVTVYNNGKRITVQEALMISNQKWLR